MAETFLSTFLEKTPAALALVRSIEARLFNERNLRPPVLDIGCGDGLFASIAFNPVINAGIDLDHGELKLAQQKSVYRFLSRANAAYLPFHDNVFQTVISNCVFEHIQHFEQAFQEIYRVLKPGGVYMFTAHSHHYSDYLFWPELSRKLGYPSIGRWYCNLINSVFRHFNCFSPAHWSALLQKAGFANVEWEYYLTKKTLQRFDQLLPLSVFSYFIKKISGQWVMLPGILRSALFYRVLLPLYNNQQGDGAGLFLVAKK